MTTAFGLLVTVLLASVPPITSNPVAVILFLSPIYEKKFTYVSHAVIVSNLFLVSTQYPMAVFPTGGQCALPNPRLNMKLKSDIKQLRPMCSRLKKIWPATDLSRMNFAVVELAEEIKLQYGTSFANFIPLGFTFGESDCAAIRSVWKTKMVTQSRDPMITNFFTEISLEDQYFDYNIEVKDMSNTSPYINVTVDSVSWDYFGAKASGQPLYCKYMVAGLLDVPPPEASCKQMSLEGCMMFHLEQEKLKIQLTRYINIQHSVVQRMLQLFKLLPQK